MSLTRQQISRMRKMRAEGMSFVDIAAELDVSASTVHRHASHVEMVKRRDHQPRDELGRWGAGKQPTEYKAPITSDWEPIRPPTLAQLMGRR